jgi:hypothetical protein
MAELKTKKNDTDVKSFLDTIENEKRRIDSIAVMQLMHDVTGMEPKMWGPSIVGFGDYRYSYTSGREGDWFIVGFSPRKAALTLYITTSFDKYPELMEKLGTYTTGKSCLYIKKLEDVDLKVLKKLVKASMKATLNGEHVF